LAGAALLVSGAAIGLWPSTDRVVSLQKLAVMGLAVALILGLPRLGERGRRALAWALVAATVLAACAGNVLVDRASWKLDALNRPVYALFAHVPRFSELAFSQNGLAAVLILAIPFGAALGAGGGAPSPRLSLHGGRGTQLAALLATAGLLLELLVTESRSAMLSLGLASGLLALFLRGRRRWLALGLPALALALLASGLVALPVSLSWLPTGGSSAERLGIWQSSLLMIADMPLTGIGLGMFQRVYPLYILPAYANIHPHAHNLFLQTYLDAGSLGCAGMLLLAGASAAAIVRLARAPRAEPLAIAAGVSWTAVVLHGQVDSYFAGDPRTYFLLFVPLGLLLGAGPAPAWRPRLAFGAPLLLAPLALPLLWTNLGSMARLHGDAPTARADFERALALAPRDWVAERGLGLMEGSPSLLRKAIDDGAPGQLIHAELARTLPPEAAVAEWRLARGAPFLVRQAADSGDPERLLRLALEVDPDQPDAKRALAELELSQRRYPEARALLEGWNGASWPRLMLALMDADRASALADLQAARRDFPGDAALAAAAAELDAQAAAAADRQAPDGTFKGAPGGDAGLGPLPAAGNDELGRAYQALGLSARADAEFAAVADPIGRYDLGRLRLDLGDTRAAIVELRQAVEAIPNQENFRLTLARVYAGTGAASLARREYEAVLGLDPGNVEARLALAG
jgi:O-antigen ligase/polysaccharide polymerase Wzy-like membrane protein/tetratricopeptide repeat protein